MKVSHVLKSFGGGQRALAASSFVASLVCVEHMGETHLFVPHDSTSNRASFFRFSFFHSLFS